MNRASFLIVFLLAVAGAIGSSLFAAPLAGLQVEGERWTFREADFAIEGILLKPEGDGPFPAMVVSHGLGGNAQSMGRMAGGEFVKMGFVCIATDYTHNSAAAMRSRLLARNDGKPVVAAAEPKGPGGQHPPDFGASAENLKRALKCVEILEGLPYVDKTRIGAYGHSMGAFLTIALAADAPGRIRAAAITAGGIAGRAGFPAPTAEVAAKVRAPFLMLHGSIDTTVRPEASAELKKVLDEHKVPNDRQVFDGVKHDINRARAEDCFRLMRDWFAKHGLLSAGA